MRRLSAIVVGILIGLSASTTISANAQPLPPPPPPGPMAPGSTTEELVDMVLDAIGQDAPAIPTATPPPR
jgi:hypothetical protein